MKKTNLQATSCQRCGETKNLHHYCFTCLLESMRDEANRKYSELAEEIDHLQTQLKLANFHLGLAKSAYESVTVFAEGLGHDEIKQAVEAYKQAKNGK